ncbi:hypothetical protein PHMEG_00027770 [Phytophthora megakarya]|uniref:Ubiquitin-like protease family profile domain-containing protein n=1 Tax=Phytophthora megakarya TaxID=4795 RepID=A0A225V856_9STRA|nr:hypothetical protein PHMEG_00027770 [Phytophthora megakarya]
MERIIKVKKIMLDIAFTLDWVEAVTWNENDLQAVQDPFIDEHLLSKGAIMAMPLGTRFLRKEATFGASLLVYREDMWLNLSCMITGMLYLQNSYKDVGFVNPSFYHRTTPSDQIKLASAFGPFEASKTRVIGVLNMSGAHWMAFYIDRRTYICYTFDPLQGSVRKMTKALREVIEPLLNANTAVSYTPLKWCKQRDGSSCGVLCLTILELLLAGKFWVDELYGLVPYLRLRYLNKSITHLAEGRAERSVCL